MTLIEQIEKLRLDMVASHAEAMALTRGLDAQIEAEDAELQQTLEGVLTRQGLRRGEIRRMIDVLAARVGRLPAPRPPALEAAEAANDAAPATEQYPRVIRGSAPHLPGTPTDEARARSMAEAGEFAGAAQR